MAGSQAVSRVTNGQSRPEPHTTVAHCLTWEPMGLPALHAPARRSAHARTLSHPLGSATFFLLASDLGLGNPHVTLDPDSLEKISGRILFLILFSVPPTSVSLF